MTDWSQVKFRASSWGNLMTESRDKKEPIGKTAIAELIKIYNQVKYGRKKDITTKAMEKGILCEPEGITMYSRAERTLFYKNEVRLENSEFTGHPDISNNQENIRLATQCHDIKCSYELDTFTPKLLEDVDKGYECQLNVYFDLIGDQCQSGSITYCLVSAPANMVLDEQRKLLYRINVATEEAPESEEAAAEMENLMIFEDIDYRERIISKKVTRNDELIAKMKAKVPLFRTWLAEFEQKHMSQYPK